MSKSVLMYSFEGFFSQDCLLTGPDVCCEIKVFVNKLNCSYRTGFYVLEFEQKYREKIKTVLSVKTEAGIICCALFNAS